MAIGDYSYWLSPQSGDATPADETGTSGDLSGGTIALVDIGGGVYVWQFTGQASVAVPARTTDPTTAGGGGTLAITVAVPTQPTGSFDGLAGWTDDLSNYRGLRITRSGGTAGRVQLNSSGVASVNLPGTTTALRTYVLRGTMSATSGQDHINAWVEGETGSGDLPDVVSSAGINDISRAWDTVWVSFAGAVVQVRDLAIWPEELSDADCHTLAEDGIRETLGGGGDVIAPVLSSPTGTATGSTTATGTVASDDATGTLYYLASTNATETVPTAPAPMTGWSSQAAGSSPMAVSASGLSPSTLHYLHYVQDDPSGNRSTRQTSASFTTSAPADPPVITVQPTADTVKSGQTAEFTITATGSGTVTYQWQRNPGGVGSWADVTNGGAYSGATSDTLSVVTTRAMDQDDFRCNVSDDDAGPVTSSVVALTVQQCVLALNATPYEVLSGASPATAVGQAGETFDVAAYPLAQWPPTAPVASASSVLDVDHLPADIGDDDLTFGTTYRMVARINATGEPFAWLMTAT
jgi:hypothetical protein